ncbi:hypothetical protein KPL71_001556 [Citrus sinensis]|uniref:Uncharacterized protein n=1 Tax=Citrus sinensis TaxID=2711 RepID=A0ACB8NZ71_CITSI|nr:hypothetical protein KPL71_001556 [Citrus sinensis]
MVKRDSHYVNSAFEEGRFCNIFHPDATGWRDCHTCKKIKAVLPPVTKRSMRPSAFQGTKSFKLATESSSPGTQKDLQDSVEVGLSLDSGKMISEKTPGAPSKKDACLPESRGQPSADSTDGADDVPSVSSKGNKKAQSDAPPKGHLLRRYTPKATDEELHQIQKDLNSVVVPLFEKTMTVSDAEPKNGRLVVPKKCAKEYLPELSEPQGFPIRMQDTNGKDWEFHFRFWPNNNSIMYVLEGLKDYLISNQCQAGDKVTFYRIEPEGKLVIGLKKAPPAILDRKDVDLQSEKYYSEGSLLKTTTEKYYSERSIFTSDFGCPFLFTITYCLAIILSILGN